MRLEAIAAYCDLVGIVSLEERQRLMRLLLTVDARVVAHHREKVREGEQRGRTAKPQSDLLQ